jgi:hypothetical protein
MSPVEHATDRARVPPSLGPETRASLMRVVPGSTTLSRDNDVRR